MNLPSPNLCRRVLPVALAMAVALPAAAQTPQEDTADSPQLIYLPSRSPSVDQQAVVQALGDIGFNVITLAYAGETRLEYARRVAAEVRALTARGVAPEAITVLGAGTGTSVAILTSAVAGKRQVNYVLLGQCDPLLKVDYRFRMRGGSLACAIRPTQDRNPAGHCGVTRPRSPTAATWWSAPVMARRFLISHAWSGCSRWSSGLAAGEWM